MKLKSFFTILFLIYYLNHSISPVINSPMYHVYDEGIKYLNQYNPIPDNIRK